MSGYGCEALDKEHTPFETETEIVCTECGIVIEEQYSLVNPVDSRYNSIQSAYQKRLMDTRALFNKLNLHLSTEQISRFIIEFDPFYQDVLSVLGKKCLKRSAYRFCIYFVLINSRILKRETAFKKSSSSIS